MDKRLWIIVLEWEGDWEYCGTYIADARGDQSEDEAVADVKAQALWDNPDHTEEDLRLITAMRVGVDPETGKPRFVE